MKRTIGYLICGMLAGAMVCLLVGCGTISGLGQDLQQGSAAARGYMADETAAEY